MASPMPVHSEVKVRVPKNCQPLPCKSLFQIPTTIFPLTKAPCLFPHTLSSPVVQSGLQELNTQEDKEERKGKDPRIRETWEQFIKRLLSS